MHVNRPVIVVYVVSAITILNTVHAQNWPSFRGPNGTGIGTGTPPATWNVSTGENVKWKIQIPGLAHSSPIVWGDKVFLTTAVSAGGQAKLDTGWLNGSGDSVEEPGAWTWRVLCFDKATGSMIWDKVAYEGTPKFKRHPKSSHANCTPVTDGHYLVAFFASEGMYCYDVDGRLAWRKDIGELNAAPAGAPQLQWGFASSPIIHDGRIILQCDTNGSSFWAAYDLKTGDEKLRVPRGDDPTWCTPAVYQDGLQDRLVFNGYKTIAAYDPSSGKEIWKFGGGGDVPVPTPLVTSSLIFITNGHGRSPIYAVRHDATGDLTPADDKSAKGMAWWSPTKGSYMPTPIVWEGVLYVGNDDGILTAWDANDGEKLFRERLPKGGASTYSASPVAAGGLIYFTSEEGDIHVIRASRNYEVAASNVMGENCMATPAISNGLLFVRCRDHLFCIGS